MLIAVIPARGGSKRIPHKNIRPFLGRPIIGYSIEAAHKSRLFDRIIVSTDDEEIAEVARAEGAETPFVRPSGISDDMTGTDPVVIHAMDWCAKHDRPVDYACCIYATAPFVDGPTLKRGYEEMIGAGAHFAMSVTSFAFPIQRALRITAEGRMEAIMPDLLPARSQDLEEAWHDAGQFYWGSRDAFASDIVDQLSLAVPIVLPRHMVQDIDTLEDWTRAELMYRALAR
jgi:pseudaminic acid cytidylyltransferase